MGSMWGRPAAPPPWPAGSGAPRWAATPKSAPRTAPARGSGGGYFWARWRQTCFWYVRAPSTPERHSGCELWGQGGANRILCHASHLSSSDKEVYSENLRQRWTLYLPHQAKGHGVTRCLLRVNSSTGHWTQRNWSCCRPLWSGELADLMVEDYRRKKVAVKCIKNDTTSQAFWEGRLSGPGVHVPLLPTHLLCEMEL